MSERSDALANLQVSLHARLDDIEAQWRRFERRADCTPFQTFDWLDTWQRNIAKHSAVQPVIVVATFADGTIACMLPLAIERKHGVRRLCWLGQDLNDYNAPLLVRDFSQRVLPETFLAAWDEMRTCMQNSPMFRYDWIELEKMPQLVGSQSNPFFNLALATNPSGAHFARLSGDWQKFYAAKRSSATRRRDRAKRKRLAEYGEVDFVTCRDFDDTRAALEALMAQKRQLFASKGIPDMFARPGWREFFLDIATNPAARDMVHVSRVQIGAICAAANLGLVFGDGYFHLLASHDHGPLAHYGPGALHLRELIAYAIGLGLKRFDFTIGDEPYKLEWSDTHIRLGDYATAATWRGWPACAYSLVRRPIKRFIKQTPWAWRAVCRIRAHLGALSRAALGVASDAAPSG